MVNIMGSRLSSLFYEALARVITLCLGALFLFHPGRGGTLFSWSLSCKSASRFLACLRFIPATVEQRMLQANPDRKTIDTAYIIPFKVTKYIRFAIFEFKLLLYITS